MQTQEKHSQAAVLGLQHLLAMYSGSILVPIMIATALGYSAEQLTYLISTDIFMCGVATFLQLQLNKYFGIGLPVVLGVAFQSVAPLIMIGQSHGSGAMFGALIASGIYVVLVSGIFSKVANLFPSIVTGSVITTIGLTLIPVAIGNMGNNVPEPTGQSLLLAAITVLIILLINIFTKGFIKSISILIGLVVGTAIAATMGLVDFSPVAAAPLVHVPTPLYFGVGLPVVLGVAFQSVAPLIMIGQSHGSGAMFGALIVSGIYVVLISGIFSKVANLFPSIVTGSVITTIGLTLIPVAIGNMGNNVPEPTGQSLLLAAITVLIILLINIFTKGFIKSISILIGLVVGTAIAATMGLVDFSPVAAAPLVHVPTPLYFGMPTFEISSIVMMCIIATVSMVESTGVYLALSDITKDPIDTTRLRNGYRAEGLAVLLGGIFNTFPYTGFSQNVGLVKLSGIKTRLPIYYAAGFLVLLGLLPKFGALAQIIPSPVLGGAMLVMFGFVSIQGMQILARVDFANNEHNFLIAAVSIAAGVGLNNSNLFVSMPTAFQMFFSNGIVVASLLAIVLNAVLNHKKK